MGASLEKSIVHVHSLEVTVVVWDYILVRKVCKWESTYHDSETPDKLQGHQGPDKLQGHQGLDKLQGIKSQDLIIVTLIIVIPNPLTTEQYHLIIDG